MAFRRKWKLNECQHFNNIKNIELISIFSNLNCLINYSEYVQYFHIYCIIYYIISCKTHPNIIRTEIFGDKISGGENEFVRTEATKQNHSLEISEKPFKHLLLHIQLCLQWVKWYWTEIDSNNCGIVRNLL